MGEGEKFNSELEILSREAWQGLFTAQRNAAQRAGMASAAYVLTPSFKYKGKKYSGEVVPALVEKDTNEVEVLAVVIKNEDGVPVALGGGQAKWDKPVDLPNVNLREPQILHTSFNFGLSFEVEDFVAIVNKIGATYDNPHEES